MPVPGEPASTIRRRGRWPNGVPNGPLIEAPHRALAPRLGGALRSGVFRGAAAPAWRLNPWQRAGGQSRAQESLASWSGPELAVRPSTNPRGKGRCPLTGIVHLAGHIIAPVRRLTLSVRLLAFRWDAVREV
jgi:hypothetical protein